ncbi:hypothetical protein HPB49_003317 [Dermacentor silvarum]|uniref:Uncharacterized protein n=1 Tax=Dermacentor silvarum TaxID=543639 RepID=A0ACB8DAT8_DERSI|nr:hypothetical protein HPB49_003317 [Dermacentor silvarum]
MKAYVASPHNAIKGILYNAIYNQSKEDIFQGLVALNPSCTFTITDELQFGSTKSILVTFINTTQVPRQLNFYGAVYSCRPFEVKVEACVNCRKPGHRADVCPKERTGLCSRCGIAHTIKPTPDCAPPPSAYFAVERTSRGPGAARSASTAPATQATTLPTSPPGQHYQQVHPLCLHPRVPEIQEVATDLLQCPETVREQAPDKAAIEAVWCRSRHSQGKKTRTSTNRALILSSGSLLLFVGDFNANLIG